MSKWINNSGMNDEAFYRLSLIGDYLDYTSYSKDLVSATGLNKPYKITVLSKRYITIVEEDPADILWRLIGSSVHDTMYRGLGYGKVDDCKCNFVDKIIMPNGDLVDSKIIKIEYDKYKLDLSKIDKTAMNRYMAEDRLRIQIDGSYISGKKDIYDRETKKISDYKLTKAGKLNFGNDEWENQLNIYAYIQRCNGQEVRELEVNALLRDWDFYNALYNKDYPQHPIHVVPLKLWTFKEQEHYIHDRVVNLKKYLEYKDDDIPECTYEERWQRPAQYAVVEVSKYNLSQEALIRIKKDLEAFDSIYDLEKLINEEFTTRKVLLNKVSNICGENFVKQYDEIICSASGIHGIDKNGKRKRAKRVVDSIEESLRWVERKKPKYQWMIEHRESDPIRCKNYCGVNGHCNFWKEYSSLN